MSLATKKTPTELPVLGNRYIPPPPGFECLEKAGFTLGPDSIPGTLDGSGTHDRSALGPPPPEEDLLRDFDVVEKVKPPKGPAKPKPKPKPEAPKPNFPAWSAEDPRRARVMEPPRPRAVRR